LNSHKNNSPVAYFIESGDDDQSHIDQLFKKAKPHQKKHWRYASHTFVEKGQVRGLEVADAFAWHWNKFYAETVAEPVRKMRKDLKELIANNPRKYKVFLFTANELETFLVEQGCIRKAIPNATSGALSAPMPDPFPSSLKQ
jgi:hypothetical protein